MNIQKQIRFVWPFLLLFSFVWLGAWEWSNPMYAGTIPTGRIRIFKETEPDGSLISFAFEAGGNNILRTFSLTDGERRRLANLAPGDGYYVRETVPAGWHQKSAICSNGSPPNNIRVGEDEVVTCTFTNEELGRIIVKKITDPANDMTTSFDFSANVVTGGASGNMPGNASGTGLTNMNFTLHNGESKILADIIPGDGYEVTEMAEDGWQLAAATCSNGSPVTNIDVKPGETVTCTFTNIQKGKLIVRKATEPNPDRTETAFAFTADNTLVPNNFTLKNDETKTFTDLTARSGYRIRELAVDHWQLTSSSCSNGSPTTNIRIDPGATVTCIFRNAGTFVDLHLTKDDGGVTAELGDTIVYTLRYRNDGTRNADGVVLAERVPDYTTFAGPDGWNCAIGAPAGTLCQYSVGNLGSLTTGQMAFKVKVASTLPTDVTAIHNLAYISYSQAANVEQSSTETPLARSVGLSLNKDDDGATAEPGGTVRYTLHYSNEGRERANAVVITETVPLYTTFAGPTTDWGCPVGTPAGTVCTQSLGTLESGTSGTSAFSVRVVDMVPANVTMLENQAQIGSSRAPNIDTGTEPTELRAAPDLAINLTNEEEAVTPGGLTRYRITFANVGTQAATNVVIAKNIPTYTTFQAASSSNGWVCDTTRCTYSVGTLASGAGDSIDFVLRLARPLPAGTASIINRASIQDDGRNGTDAVTGNNSAQITTQITDPHTIVATKAANLVVDTNNDGEVSPRDTLEYVLTIHNQRGIAVRNVNVVDTLDASLRLVSTITTTQGTVGLGNQLGDPEVQVNIGTLAGDSTVVIRFRVQVRSPLSADVASVSNQGVIESRELPIIRTDDPSTAEINDKTITPINGTPRLTLTLSDYLFVDRDNNTLVSVGDTLIYWLRLRNTGNRGVPALQVRVPVAENVALVRNSVTTSMGTVREGNDPDDEVVHVALGDVAGGAEVNISFQVQILDQIGFTTIAHQATVTSESASGAATVLSDDPDTAESTDATISVLNQEIITTRRLYLPVLQR